MSNIKTLVYAIAMTLPLAGMAASPANQSVSSNTVTGTLSPQQRGAAIGAFVRKWGPYAQQVYGVDVRTWSSRLVGEFAHGDATNIQRSLTRTTFEGAMAELAGVGHRSSDAQVINKLAAAKASGAMVGTTTDLLGDTNNDLVFTPIPPCRIADTRNTGGQIAANSDRGFNAWGVPNYTAFGGSNTNCGLQSEHPSAVVLNVTGVLPAAAGFATVYAGDLASPPFVASINYATGAIVNNNVVVALNSLGGSPDYRIYTLRASHYVVDIVGFYDTPHATALECITLPGTPVSIPAGANGQAHRPSCAAGYTETAIYCQTASFDTDISNLSEGVDCTFKNNSGTAVNGRAYARCCRVPGR